VIDLLEMEMLGLCAFCENATHDYPDTEWHEEKHNQGYHTCGIDGGFRNQKPLCENMRLASGLTLASPEE